MLAAATLVTFTLVAHDHDQASSLYPYYNVNESGRLALGTTMLIGSDVQPRGSRNGHRVIDLRAVTPRVTINSAHATIRVLECTVADPHLGLGLARLDKERGICAVLKPYRPGSVDLGFPATEIGYLVTPTSTGQVRVDGADVSYVDRGLPGEQHAGSGFALRITRVTK